MKRLYITEFDFGGADGNSFMQFSESMFPNFTQRGQMHVSLFNPLLASIGNRSLLSDGLLGVVADDAPVPTSTVVLFQEIAGAYVEVGRQLSSDGSWSFNTLGKDAVIAVSLKEGYNAGVVSGLIPGVADE